MTQAVDATSSTNEASAKSALSMAISSVQADFFAEVWTNNASATFDEVCNTEAVQAYMEKDDDGNEYIAEIGEWSSGEAVCTVTYKGETYTCTLALTSSKTGASIGDWGKSSGSSSSGSNVETISTADSYVGYYADVDDDGTVDGVIYVDLMHEQTAEYWSPGTTSSYYITIGTYSWDTITSSKEYYISQESYTDSYFGTHPVLSPVDGSTGNDRFYVMALSNFTTSSYSTFYWYYAAYSNGMSDYSTATSTDFGAGKTNTNTMISYWNNKTYGSQNTTRDLWGVIQDEVEDGWFVPSSKEWAAFGGELGITTDNYSSTYGLSNYCWSSSQGSTDTAYSANFLFGYINYYTVDDYFYVRLTTTF